MNKLLTPMIALVAAAVLFFAGNLFVQRAVSGARIDLTQGKLYTLSEGSRNIARSLKEPIRLTLYYSEKQGNDVPAFKAYATRVRELLQEFASVSGGKVQVTTVNPEPFSDAEDRAVQAGLAGVPVGRGNDRFYFGLVGVNSTDRTETIPFFDPGKEGFLEYDLTRLVYLLSDAPKKTIGVMSWLPIDGQQMNPMNPMQRGGTPPYQIYKQLQDVFDVKLLATDSKEIPAEVKVLLVIHPKNPSPQVLYAIDQFVLKGGRLVAMVDPLCENDVPPGMNPMQALSFPKASNLDTLFGAWGVEMVKDKVAADRTNAVRVGMGGPNRPENVDYVAWLNLKDASRDANDPITGQLQNFIVASAGILKPKDGATTTFQPLLSTSTNSMALDASAISFVPDPKKLLGDFKSEGKSLTVAARISGKVKSAFPDGAPKAEPKPGEAAPAETPPTAAHVGESADSIGVVVFADCDMIMDRFWVQEDKLGPISLGWRKVSDNGDLVIGAIDNLSGSSDLISLRARGTSARPFETVQQLQKDAEQRYAAKEQELQNRLRETEQKITELQRSRGENDKGVLLSPEQQKEIENFRTQMVSTRKELRDVQHQLRKDIEGLGSRIKAINIALVPLLVGVAALGLAAYRGSRRRADRLAASAKE